MRELRSQHLARTGDEGLRFGSARRISEMAREKPPDPAVGLHDLRNGTSHLYIGEGASNTEQFTGKIDEMVLTNSAMSNVHVYDLCPVQLW